MWVFSEHKHSGELPERSIELTWFDVHKSYQKRHIGTTLLTYALTDVARAWNSTTIPKGVFLCDVSYPKTGVYTRVGFTPASGGNNTYRWRYFPKFDSIAERMKMRRMQEREDCEWNIRMEEYRKDEERVHHYVASVHAKLNRQALKSIC